MATVPMKKSIDVHAVKMRILDPHANDALAKTYLESTYDLWNRTWLPVWQEFEKRDRLCSDNFTKQDILVSLFEGDFCFLMGSFRRLNLLDPWVRNDSYFFEWPDTAYAALADFSPTCLVGSQITLAPELHGYRFGFSLRDLCVGLMTRLFVESGENHMAGTMRVDRKVHESAYLFGADLLQADVAVRNVPVDLVHFQRERVHFRGAPLIESIVSTMWNNREDFSQFFNHPAMPKLRLPKAA